MTVTVERNGVLIGTATGAAADPEAAGVGGLEVNHGPEAAALPGDCWEGNTPDIRPGDVVTATGPTGTDQVIVDNIAFTGDPVEQRERQHHRSVRRPPANGNAIPAGRIDSGEFRGRGQQPGALRGSPRGSPWSYPASTTWSTAHPFQPTRNDDNAPFNQTQLRRALLGDGHAVGFGHVDPLPREAMLQDGLGDTPGPAPGCKPHRRPSGASPRRSPGASTRRTWPVGSPFAASPPARPRFTWSSGTAPHLS